MSNFYLPAKMSAEVLPKAKSVTPAMFCDKPSVFEIMNNAGHRLHEDANMLVV